MKLIKGNKEFKTNNAGKSIQMEMGNIDSIAYLLQRATYKKPKQTSFQEYLCNARDANKEVGNENPIEVTLPTVRKPVIKIRDYGPGLSPDRVVNVFVKYGTSTKNDSNDQTGGFGIGAKSAWSFTDSFQITSYHEGLKYVYLAHKGNSVAGELTVLTDGEKTDQANGVEIEIAVEKDDVSLFISAFYRTTWLWTVKPTVKGLSKECISSLWSDTDWDIEGQGYKGLLKNNFTNIMGNESAYGKAEKLFISSITGLRSYGDDDDIYSDDDIESCIANIDGIPYHTSRSAKVSEHINHEMIYIVDFAVGELEIAADRENLVSTSNSKNNKKNLPRFDQKIELIKSDILALVESQESLNSKIQVFRNEATALKAIKVGFKFKGKTYRVEKRNDGYNSKDDTRLEIPMSAKMYSFHWKTDSKKGEETHSRKTIDPSDLTHMILIDEVVSENKIEGFHYYGKNKTKVKHNFWNLGSSRYKHGNRQTGHFIVPASQAELDEVLSLPLSDLGIIKLSDLDSPVYQTSSRVKGENVKKAHEVSYRSYDGSEYNDKLNSTALNASSEFLDSEDTLIVCKDGNSPVWPKSMETRTIASMILFFRKYRNMNVVSVKKSVFESLQADGVGSFVDACKNLKLSKTEKMQLTYPDFPCMGYAEYERTTHSFGRSNSYTQHHSTDNSELSLYNKINKFRSDALKKLKNKKLKAFIETCLDMRDCHNSLLKWSDRQRVREFLKLKKDYDATVKDLVATDKDFCAKYPLLYLDFCESSEIGIVEYINAIDKKGR